MMDWQPIETAPKGGGAEMVTDPAWVEPPMILMAFEDGEISVVYWDWYYADSGNGWNGMEAWIIPAASEQAALHYGSPTHWMPLPPPPQELKP